MRARLGSWAVGSLGDCPFDGWYIVLASIAALSLLLHDRTLAVVARAQVAAWHQGLASSRGQNRARLQSVGRVPPDFVLTSSINKEYSKYFRMAVALAKRGRLARRAGGP
jgi:hypothetical protein